MFCLFPQLSPEDYRENTYTYMPEEVDTDVSSALSAFLHNVMFCSVVHNVFIVFPSDQT